MKVTLLTHLKNKHGISSTDQNGAGERFTCEYCNKVIYYYSFKFINATSCHFS